ncbi:MAG: class I SAM-dependent methyltransferase [Planctomycetota bacterium]
MTHGPPEIRLIEIACPLCGERSHEEQYKTIDHTGTIPGEFRLVRCVSCGLTYLNPRPSVRDLAACYPPEYTAHRPPSEQKRRTFGLVKRLLLRQYYGWPFNGHLPRRSALLRLVLSPLWKPFSRHRRNLRLFPFEGRGRLLDVGCGSGRYLDMMRTGGWTVTGVEPDPEAAERARALRHLNVHTGTVTDAPLERESFDVITLWHVLEHVWNPNEVMERITGLLAPGGLLVVSTPVIDGYAARTLGSSWYHLDVPRHLLHFTRRRLTDLIAFHGFVVTGVVDDPHGSGWRRSFPIADESLRRAGWFQRLATNKRHRRRFDAELARRGEASVVIVHARKR